MIDKENDLNPNIVCDLYIAAEIYESRIIYEKIIK